MGTLQRPEPLRVDRIFVGPPLQKKLRYLQSAALRPLRRFSCRNYVGVYTHSLAMCPPLGLDIQLLFGFRSASQSVGGSAAWPSLAKAVKVLGPLAAQLRSYAVGSYAIVLPFLGLQFPKVGIIYMLQAPK